MTTVADLISETTGDLVRDLISPDPIDTGDALLQEDGFFLLQEDGSRLLLE